MYAQVLEALEAITSCEYASCSQSLASDGESPCCNGACYLTPGKMEASEDFTTWRALGEAALRLVRDQEAIGPDPHVFPEIRPSLALLVAVGVEDPVGLVSDLCLFVALHCGLRPASGGGSAELPQQKPRFDSDRLQVMAMVLTPMLELRRPIAA